MGWDRIFWMIGALYGFLGVAFGAFGAHALKLHLSADLLVAFEVGVRYQMVHACALLAAAWAYTRWPQKALIVGGWLFVVGIALFSGSLYVLSLSDVRSFGAVTPFGGVALLGGWACLAWAAWRGERPHS